MSLSRQMRRKAERDKAKAEKKASRIPASVMLPPISVKPFTFDDIYDDEQVKAVALEWLEEQYDYLTKITAEDTTQLLWEAENNTCYINTLLMLMTVEKTFGELKTVQKGMEKLLQNMGPCLDRIQQEGPKKCFAELMEKYDIGEIEFDTFAENELFDKETRLALTIQLIKDKWIRDQEERKKRKEEGKRKHAD